MLGTLGRRLVRAGAVAAAARGLARVLLGQLGSAPRTSRRDFLRWTVAGAGTFFLAEAAAGFVAFFWPTKIGAFGGEIQISRDAIPPVGAAPIVNREGKFWLIHNEDGVLALYWKCVHLGCTVPWNQPSGEFQCPCHGSIYDRRGVRLAGPAPRPLDIMRITTAGEGITVDTGEIIIRSEYDPSQATKI